MVTLHPRAARSRAHARVKRTGLIVYSESPTFGPARHARDWGERLSKQLARPGAIEARAAARAKPDCPTEHSPLSVAGLIKRYIDYVDPIQPLGQSKRAILKAISVFQPLASKLAAQLDHEDILAYARARKLKGVGPATVGQDLIYLRGVLAMAKPAFGLEAVSARPIDEVLPLLRQLGLVGPSGKRDRRPTGEELKRLYAHFEGQTAHHSTKIPMRDLCEYAIWTGKRESEICRVRWADLDPAGRVTTQILRDMKHPRHKIGNDFRYPLLGEAYDIVSRQPKLDERIFPFKANSVSQRFTYACRVLKIEHLHFHDLRREAASRLFEEGYVPHEVAQVTGHKSLDTLWQVYTKLDPEKLEQSRARREARERKRPARRLRVVS